MDIYKRLLLFQVCLLLMWYHPIYYSPNIEKCLQTVVSLICVVIPQIFFLNAFLAFLPFLFFLRFLTRLFGALFGVDDTAGVDDRAGVVLLADPSSLLPFVVNACVSLSTFIMTFLAQLLLGSEQILFPECVWNLQLITSRYQRYNAV